ncbi:MAG: cold shock domain-containing protein [Paludibacter sp.]|jgi:cold shock CspA family protein|nr:cold shock domain-containing protein [Paludibacter sp.]
MAISYNKKELEKKKQGKKLEKQKRKEERKASGGSSSFDDMIAYVDENGNITTTPPDPGKKQKIDVANISVSTPKKEDQEEVLMRGRVEHFNSEKGYGFIKDLNSTEKYFFHISAAPSDITEGHIVTFQTERGQKGMNAVNITQVKD